MIKIENVDAAGVDAALRGMRNPLNSWAKSDSKWNDTVFEFGNNDVKLAKQLAKSGPSHRKYLRMLVVWMDITAPLYWWKEFDTYKVGTVSNSCSTMHKIHERPLTLEDFSVEHLTLENKTGLMMLIVSINEARNEFVKTKDKDQWWQMIQLLPSSYNQRRTVMFNYEVAANIYATRRNHKLDEWHKMCDMIERLPGFELIKEAADE